MRHDGRKNDQMREVSLKTDVSNNADGSCLVKFGNTHVLCTATIDKHLPRFLKGKGSGWVTAEYGMLPASASGRIKREASQGKQSGRTMEIQRLIGRSLRSVTDLKALGEYQIIIDCDVLQADGGTRTASITGGYVALHQALEKLCMKGNLKNNPLTEKMAAISCGIYKGEVVVDLDYIEDSNAGADANFVMTSGGKIIEIQGTAEGQLFSSDELIEMMELSKVAIADLVKLQEQAMRSDLWQG